jgi:guanylate kinase
MVIYLDTPVLDRLERLNNRNDLNDSISRRMKTDDEQFDTFKDYEIRITNPDF